MTVIIIPKASTTDHAFEGTTYGGRKVRMTVTANVEIQPSAVLADLQAYMPQVDDLKPVGDDEPINPLLAGIGAVGLWVGVLIASVFAIFLAHKAGFINVYSDAAWPEFIPVVGGHEVLFGLFRLWVAMIPLIMVVMAIWAWHDNKNSVT